MYKNKIKNSFRKIISGFILFTFLVGQIWSPSLASAQSAQVLNLPMPGAMVSLSNAFNPVIITGMTIHPENPLQFDFIIDTGDDRLQGEALAEQSRKLINYFMATLTVPEDEMWVNLSPYEKNRIIADGLSKTEMGRDMLGQDYILKQLTASLLYPEGETGKVFWQKVQAKAKEKFGTNEIPTSTFNKVWIVPQDASVYVHDKNVFVTNSRLKVMLEEDYFAQQSAEQKPSQTSSLSSQVVREVVIPEIEKEVNEGKNFATLRQIFSSMILATWYKKKLKGSLFEQAYLNKNKTSGIELDDKTAKEKIYNQYLEAFKKGVYNYIKEDVDAATQESIPRKYFSGGARGVSSVIVDNGPSQDLVKRASTRTFVTANVDAKPASSAITDLPVEKIKGTYFPIRTNLDDTHFDLVSGVIDDPRLNHAIETIRYITERGGKVILFNHIGRPNGKYNPNLRTDDIAKALSKLLGKEVKKTNGVVQEDGSFQLIGEEERGVAAAMQEGDVMMLENTRMDPREQSANKSERMALARDIVSLVPPGKGIFVVDGFPITHRDNTASLTDIAELLPGVKGLWQVAEERLHDDFSRWMSDPAKRGRLIAFFGGAKADKSEEISEFAREYLQKW